MNYRASGYDNCIFVKSDSNGLHIIIVYVDDLMILSKCTDEHDNVNAMKNEFKEITISAEKTCSTEYIGRKIEVNPDISITISMEQYITNIILVIVLPGYSLLLSLIIRK